MRRGANYEREDAITLAATHLGLNRVGKKVDEAFRSAIRRGILNHEGNLIWREA
ncbi:MAG: hypothetical protein O7E49_07440 [Gemmatimonadetes bacterium]|nr:hypothetical protein [Gemmatimonadota bacterium]